MPTTQEETKEAVNAHAHQKDERVGTYFSKAAETFDTFYDNKRGPFMRWVDRKYRSDVFVRYEWVFAEIGDAKGKTILDIGCGSGPYSVEAATRGATRVLGIDMAPGMLEIARRRAEAFGVSDRCEFREGAFPQDAPDESFDHIIVTGVMDYVADAAAFVKAAARITKGSAIMSLPSKHWFRTPFRQIRYKLKSCPVYFFDPEEIKKYFADAGFNRTDLRKIPGSGQDWVAIGRKS
jgi:ubiquinone/menaquinone biosynthesis C-methylase UbiE